MRTAITPTQRFGTLFGRQQHPTSSRSSRMAVQAIKGCGPGSYIPGFLKRIGEVNNGFDALASGTLIEFVLDGQQLGYLKPEFVQQLLAHPTVFQEHGNCEKTRRLTICEQHSTSEERSKAVAGVLASLRAQGLLPGWRDELFPVTPGFDAQPLLLIERAAAPFFGIRAYGVHVNGWVQAPDGGKLLWVARRSKTKQTWPGLLDHIVAGGQPYGLSCAENVVKECWEEAGIPRELASRAVPVGYVSYVSMIPEGLKQDVLFCYDLQLPADFVPQPQDGEVEEFMLMDLERVAGIMSGSDEYKPNCCLVVIDFLIRHGFITPEEPGYVKLLSQLRLGSPA